MEKQVIEQVKVVAEARKKVANLNRSYAVEFSKWQDAHKELILKKEEAILELQDAEDALRIDTLAAFKDTGNKKPAPGVEVKNFKILEYAAEKALAWAMEKGLALSLDKKVFESIASGKPNDTNSVVPCVAFRWEDRAQIATDLEKALGFPSKEG